MPYDDLTYQPLRTFRATAVLPGSPTFDPNPAEILCPGFDFLVLYFGYTRGAVGGEFQALIEFSPFVSAPASGGEWFAGSAIEVPTITGGSNVISLVQGERIQYGSTGSGLETFAFGPVSLQRAVQRMRISATETGVVGTPGDLQIVGLFSNVRGVHNR